MNFEDSSFDSNEKKSSAVDEVLRMRDELLRAGGQETFFDRAQQEATEDMLALVEDYEEQDEGGDQLQELIEQAPDLNDYEAFLLEHMSGLVEISADVLPSFMRLLPAIKSGDLAAIGDSLDFPVVLRVLREGMIKDEVLRADLLNLFSDWVKTATVEAIRKHTGESVPQAVLDNIAQDVDLLLQNPENQVAILDIFLDEDVLPKIISGEDLDLETEIALVQALGKKGQELWNLNHLQTLLGDFWDGMTTAVITDLLWEGIMEGDKNQLTDEVEQSEEVDPGEIIPDFFSNQENADELARFFEAHKDQLVLAGKDLPVLYLAIRAVFNADFDNPAIEALAGNNSLGVLLTDLRLYIEQDPGFREVVLEQSGKGIVFALKSIVPGDGGSRDWEAVQSEINGLIAGSPELQTDYLDFIFLQFERGSIIDALKGNINPAAVVGEIYNIPFVRNLMAQLGDKEKTPNLRAVLTEVSLVASLGLAKKEVVDSDDLRDLEAELRLFSDNPRLQDAFFSLLQEDDFSSVLDGLNKVLTGNYFEGAEVFLNNEQIQIILTELKEFVKQTDKTEEYVLNIAINNLGEYLNKIYPGLANGAESLRQIVVDNKVMRENILQLALDPAKMRLALSILREASFENLEEVVGALRDIPEVDVILNGLSDVLGKKSEQRDVLVRSLVEVALDYVGQNFDLFQGPEGQRLLVQVKPQLKDFLINSDVLKRGFDFVITPGGAQLISQIMDSQNEPQRILTIVNDTPELRGLVDDVLVFVKNNIEVQQAVLNYVCSLDERLRPVQAFFDRDPAALQSIMDFACNLENLNELSNILLPFVSGEGTLSGDLLVSVGKLSAYPNLRSFVDAFSDDFSADPEAWQETIKLGVDLFNERFKSVIGERLSKMFGLIDSTQIEKALDSVENLLVGNIEIQKKLVDFISNPENINSLASLLGEFEKPEFDPVKMINLIGGNEKLVSILSIMTDSLLSDSGFRKSVTEIALSYMNSLDISFSSSDINVSVLIDALLSHKDLKSVLDSAIANISSDEWADARERLFAQATETSLDVIRHTMAQQGVHLGSEKWGEIKGRMSFMMGSNEAIQQAVLRLATDLDAVRALVALQDGGDFAILRHPDVKIIVEEVGNFFVNDPETWGLVKNEAFDVAYDWAVQDNPLKLSFSEDKREDFRQIVLRDIHPTVFDVEKLIVVANEGSQMLREPSFSNTLLRGRVMAKALEIPVLHILRAYV